MRILMVSSFLPYPLFSGGQIRLYNLLKELSDKHEITLICEKRSNQTEADVRQVEKICKKVITVERRRQWGIGNILKTAASTNSFLVTGHTSKELKEKIEKELVDNKHDLIHVETFYVMQNLPEDILSFPRMRESIRSGSPIRSGMTGVGIPIVLAEHNIEYQVYERFTQNASLLIRPLLLLDIAKIKREEEAFWKKATKLIAVSGEDKNVMTSVGVNADIVANGVDTEKFSLKGERVKRKGGRILFIGDFKWLQNRDAVSWIIKEIFPKIKSVILERSDSEAIESRQKEILSRTNPLQDDNIKLWIVGRKIPESLRNLTTDPNIIFDEEASSRSAEELFQEASVLLAPIRVGGGTSYKILESMSCGTPVVTMPLSSNAIEARDVHDIMVGETASELAGKTLSLLSDENLYDKIAINGRKLIEEKYTWEKIAGDLEEVYKQAIS